MIMVYILVMTIRQKMYLSACRMCVSWQLTSFVACRLFRFLCTHVLHFTSMGSTMYNYNYAIAFGLLLRYSLTLNDVFAYH